MLFKDAKRIVIKVGTSTLVHPSGMLNIRKVEALVKILSDLKNAGKDIILVTSGAIGLGVGKLKLRERPTDMPTKQAAAAVGQCELMYIYDKLFAEYNHVVAQILLTRDVIGNETRKANVVNTFNRLIEMGAIPIVNENDSVSTEEIGPDGGEQSTFGQNDTLSAIVAVLTGADVLVNMSDVDGLYDADPHKNPDAKLIPVVAEIDGRIAALAGGKGSSLGSGGAATKIDAAKIVCDAGIDMYIINGSAPAQLYELAEGVEIGTRFCARC